MRRRSLGLIILGMIAIAVIVAVGLNDAPDDETAALYSPSGYHFSLANGQIDKAATVAISGQVKPDSVYVMGSGDTGFILTDGHDELHAIYRGVASPLLAQDKAIVAKGRMDSIGVLQVHALRPLNPETDKPFHSDSHSAAAEQD